MVESFIFFHNIFFYHTSRMLHLFVDGAAYEQLPHLFKRQRLKRKDKDQKYCRYFFHEQLQK